LDLVVMGGGEIEGEPDLLGEQEIALGAGEDQLLEFGEIGSENCVDGGAWVEKEIGDTAGNA
jgi:hypothetical protein